jgi:hypothetical protein
MVEPDKPSALEGRQSTQGKAASSMMLHTGRRRNANEFCGAFGHSLTYDDMGWLAKWLLIRGCNLLIPHAFYYSIRGPRRDERPPDVGLHSAWWGAAFKDFALASRRLCWLNTDSQQVCHVAILGEHHNLPTRAAKVCFQNQIDFNYLDVDDLLNSTTVENQTLRIADQAYHALIIDGDIAPIAQSFLDTFTGEVAVIVWDTDSDKALTRLRQVIPPDIAITPQADGLRVRHVRKDHLDWYILFNEGAASIAGQISLSQEGDRVLIDPYANTIEPFNGQVVLAAHAVRVLVVKAID